MMQGCELGFEQVVVSFCHRMIIPWKHLHVTLRITYTTNIYCEMGNVLKIFKL